MSEVEVREEQERVINRARGLHIFGGAGTLLWPVILPFVLPDAVEDSVGERAWWASIIIAIGFASYFSEWIKKRLNDFVFYSSSLATVFILKAAYANNMHLVYLTGVYMLIFACSTMIVNRWQNIAYGLLVTGVNLFHLVRDPTPTNIAFTFSSAMGCAMIFIMVSNLLRLMETIRASREKLNETNRNMDSILNSLGQGFLMFNSDGRVGEISSKACEDLLEGNPQSKMIQEVLGIPEDKKESFKTWVSMSFNQPIPFEDLKNMGPKDYPHKNGKAVELDYFPVKGENEKIENLVLVATDKTQEREALEREKKAREKTELLIHLATNRTLILGLLRRIDEQIKTLNHFVILEKNFDEGVFMEEYKRFLHNSKGSCGSFGMSELASYIHELEEVWVGRDFDKETFFGQLRGLKESLENFVEKNKEILGEDVFINERIINIRFSEVKELSEKVQRTSSKEEVASDILSIGLEPVGRYFKHYEGVMTNLARGQGKVIKVYFENADLKVLPENYGSVFEDFIHVFNNAVDHGIEFPIERDEAGKEVHGKIDVKFNIETIEKKEWLHIQVKDDGSGVDERQFTEVLKKKGLVKFLDRSYEEKIQAVFEADFSTRESVSEVSGRGIGLNALKESVEAIGGRVRIQSWPGQGSQFDVRVPYINTLLN